MRCVEPERNIISIILEKRNIEETFAIQHWYNASKRASTACFI